jgi:signal-transduction protein with cAMP-binding, CBS, and nucleotidyltransferase domain
MSELELNAPKTIDAEELLYKAQAVFAETKVDSLVVVSEGKVVGVLDVQDMIK